MHPVLALSITSGLIASAVCIYLSRELGRMRKLLSATYEVCASQHIIINAMLSKGIEVRCDYCGNPMAPNVAIAVVEQDDGSLWVQHQSHGVG